MTDRWLADATVLLHAAFVVFAVAGGLLVARWPHVAWAHLPAVAWAAWVEIAGWICPLTPLENYFRRRAGEAEYTASFIEHHLLPVLYPSALSREVQWLLGALVLAINVALYAAVLRRRARRRHG